MLTAVLVYLSILVLIGTVRRRRVKTGDDFLVAGRTLPARVLVFTLLATWIGSGSLFGGAGLGYRAGFPALWQSAGAWAGIALVYFIAPRVRRIAQYTVPDILELRYGPTARVLGTVTPCWPTPRSRPISSAAAAGCWRSLRRSTRTRGR